MAGTTDDRTAVCERVIIRPAITGDHATLVDLWRRSVTATHTFLTGRDIADLLPVVRDQALPALDLWVACEEAGSIVAFLGLSGSSVEALFVAPEWMRRGLGRRLLDHARRTAGERLRVDVNEQNPAALRFYEACGFRVVGRSPLDAGGRPFPLLHLEEAGGP